MLSNAHTIAFVRVRPTQYLFAHNPETRRVLRILDGRRDLPRFLDLTFGELRRALHTPRRSISGGISGSSAGGMG